MRQYLFILFILASSLVACNQSEVGETSSENRVHTFTFYEDTLNPGLTQATYKIEHRTYSQEHPDTGLIYCKDSLKFGTRLDSVVPYITYKATPGSATFYLPNDTIVSTGNDTIDLTQKPVYLHILASDMKTERWYRIDINVHKINPDLYVWEKLVDNIFPKQDCHTKAFYFNNKFVLFVNNGVSTQIYTSSTMAESWDQSSDPLIGLPTPCYVKDIVQQNDTLYYIDKGQLYTSTNCFTWTATDYSNASFKPINMLLPYNGLAWCIIQERDSNLMLATIQNNQITPQTNIEGYENGYIPNTFPISDFAATSFTCSSERPRAIVVGGRKLDGNPVNSRWSFEYIPDENKYRLIDFTISQPSFKTLTGASIIQYDGKLMMFGGLDNDLEWNSNILYSDDEGMHWYVPDTACNQLPMEYQSRQNQSVIVNQKSIYLIGGQSHNTSFSDVYRGRLNSLQ